MVGHSGLLLPEKNIYKKGKNMLDYTLVPLDHEIKGQIRDFHLFHHFVRPMANGVKVTCILDGCNDETAIDLPYTLISDPFAKGMEENFDNISNLAFMYTAGGLELPDIFDGEVRDRIELSTNQNIEALQGIYVDEVTKDGSIVTGPTVANHNLNISPSFSEERFNQGFGLGDTMSLNFDNQSQALVPADVRIISICRDTQKIVDVCKKPKGSDLPNPAGQSGGVLTRALLDVFYSSDNTASFQQVLFGVKEKLNKKNCDLPQISSSIQIDAVEKPAELFEGEGKKWAILVGIDYVGQNGELKCCQKEVLEMKTYIQDVLGVSEDQTVVLMDDGINKKPTRRNILLALQVLVKASKAGDSVLFQYIGKVAALYLSTWIVNIKLLLILKCVCMLASDSKLGHGNLLAPEKNILKTQNGECDETLIPVDHENNGQIRDFDLYHHFIRPMTKGVTVTCIIDCCHGGSVLDLPYHYCPDNDSTKMKKDVKSIGNLALLHKLGDFSLPEAFADNIVQNNIEYLTGKKLDEIHGMYSNDLTEDSYLVGHSSKASTMHNGHTRAQNKAENSGVEEVEYTTFCCCCKVPISPQEQTHSREQTQSREQNPPSQQQMYRSTYDDDDDLEDLAIDLLLFDSFSSSDHGPPPAPAPIPPPPAPAPVPPPPPIQPTNYSSPDDYGGLSSPLLDDDYGDSYGNSYGGSYGDY